MSRLTYGQMRSRAEVLADEQIKGRVLAGLEVLQDEFGDSWVEKIDCKTLLLHDSAQCVLGQIYGDYDEGVYELNDENGDVDDVEWGVQHGFYAGSDSMRAWTVLDDAWHKVLCDGEGTS